MVEVDGSDTTVRKTYSAGSTSLAVRTIVNGSTETLNWLLSDHLGSSSITTTADGTWNSEIRYSAFGETRYSSGITPTDYRYTGQLEQADVNLYYYNARYYDAALGRFIQADTIIPDVLKSIDWNLYTYVSNNSIKYADPSGHMEFEETPYDGYFIPAHAGVNAARKSTTPYAYTKTERPKIIYNLGKNLKDRVVNSGMDPIDAIEVLFNYSSTLYDTETESYQYMTDMTCAINGYCSRDTRGLLRVGVDSSYEKKSFPSLGQELFPGEGSWSTAYYDYTGNQLYHFWFYTALTYFNNSGIALVGNYVHDPSIDINIPPNKIFENGYNAQKRIQVSDDNKNDGYSQQDYDLGIAGIQVGRLLKNGFLTIDEIGAWVKNNLSN